MLTLRILLVFVNPKLRSSVTVSLIMLRAQFKGQIVIRFWLDLDPLNSLANTDLTPMIIGKLYVIS